MKKQVNFRLDDRTLELLQVEALYRGIHATDVLREKLENDIKFPEPVNKFLERYSKGLKRPRPQIIESIIISFMARQAVINELDISGQPIPEFASTNEGPLLGKELFDLLYQLYSEEFQRVQKLEYEAHGLDGGK
jgi:hypothetical protein